MEKNIESITERQPDLLEQLYESTDSLPIPIAQAVINYRRDQYQNIFNGLLTVTSTTKSCEKVPRPKIISALNKRLRVSFEQQTQKEEFIKQGAQNLAESNDVDLIEARQIILASSSIAQSLRNLGLEYKGEPFNFALSSPYPFSKKLAENIAQISTQALQAVEKLSRENNFVNFLLNKGSTLLERRLWQQNTKGYLTAAPLNRIDLVNGKVIEFGPTYTDGFATAQAFAESWGISSQSVQTLAQTFIKNYEEMCLNLEMKPKNKPSLGLAYIPATEDMRDEMRSLGRFLDKTEVFGEIYMGFPSRLTDIDSLDIIYYYLKPSMVDGYEGQPLPEGRFLIEGEQQNKCVIPPLKEQLGKKIILALFSMYPKFFDQELGSSNYQDLLGFVAPTMIVSPETKIPDGEWVLKPSSEGSCNGVIDSNSSDFLEKIRTAQLSFYDETDDAFVLQQKYREKVSLIWVKQARKLPYLAGNLSLKQTLMVAGGKPAGAFATASSKWIIDDSGFGFPCRLIGGINNE